MRNFSMKSISIAIALTLTLAAAPSFAAGRQDRTADRDRRCVIERVIDSLRRFIITIKDLPEVPRP